MVRPKLVSVVGPTSIEMFETFLNHYESLGVEGMLLAFHAPHGEQDESVAGLRAVAKGHGHDASTVKVGPWDETMNQELLRTLRLRDGPRSWHVIADTDELHQYPMALDELHDLAVTSGSTAVDGVLVDRIHPSGSLARWPEDNRPDLFYSLGGFFTPNVLGADPRKIVMARADQVVEIGQHWSPTATLVPRQLAGPTHCHHFKWVFGVADYLIERRRKFETGEWREESPAMRAEVSRFLAHLDANGGRIDAYSESSRFRPCGVSVVDPTLNSEAENVVEVWSERLGG